MGESCPSSQEIRRCCQGFLSDEQTTAILQHIATCARCSDQLEEIERQESPLVDSLRESSDIEGNVPDSCRRMMDAAADLAAVASWNAVDQGKSDLDTRSMADEPQDTVISDSFNVQEDESQDASLSHAFQTGERFGDYEILDEIERGGMGVVFRARQVSLDRIVALKMILDSRLASQDAVARFRSEASAAAKLEHTGIVPIYDIGEVNGQHFFSMMLIDGGSLKRFVADQELSLLETAALMSRIARVVQFAHSRNIVHRDLKLANVLIDSNGDPWLTDFGLAKDLAGEAQLTSDGQILGTPSYMSPEQARGSSEQVGPLSDVYSLGAMLYHLITGRLPFNSSNVLDTLQSVLSDEPTSPQKFNEDIDLDLQTICLKCLEKDPQLRYPSAAELADDLDLYLAGAPISARAISLRERMKRWCRRNPAPVYGTLATAILSAAALIYSVVTLESEVDSFEETLDAVAWRSVRETSDWVADAAQYELERKFHQVSIAAEDAALKERLGGIVGDAERYQLIRDRLEEWEAKALRGEDANYEELPQSFSLLQEWVAGDVEWWHRKPGTRDVTGPEIAGFNRTETATNVVAWWVCGPDGFQLARSPWEYFRRRDFAFRSYFTGLPEDQVDGAVAGHAWKGDDGPRLSAVFRTQETNYWVVAISAPVWQDEEFLGVVGVFLRLGSFLERPEQMAGVEATRYAMLIDPRTADESAIILEHPYHNHPSAQVEGRLRDDVALARVSRAEWESRVSLDVFGSPKFDATDEFGGVWRTAWSTVNNPDGSDRNLVAVVRESVELVQKPSRNLRTNLHWLGIATVGMFVLPPLMLLVILARRSAGLGRS